MLGDVDDVNRTLDEGQAVEESGTLEVAPDVADEDPADTDATTRVPAEATP